MTLERITEVSYRVNKVVVPAHAEVVYEDEGSRGRYETPKAVGAKIVPEKILLIPYTEEREVWKIAE